MSEIRLSPKVVNSPDVLTDILVFERKWDNRVDLHYTLALLADSVTEIESEVTQAIDDLFAMHPDMPKAEKSQTEELEAMTRLNALLDCFYFDQAFSSTCQGIAESSLNSLVYLIHYHTGEVLSMTVLLNHLLRAIGFDSAIVAIDHQLMLRVLLYGNVFIVIDALCGEVDKCAADPHPAVLPVGIEEEHRVLDRVSLLQIFLTQQKLAFIEENDFEKALCCIELLIQTTPEDPYQRRDRGFLLHQLDCFKLARDDFEFFIDQCPEDPGAQLLKTQLEEFDGNEQTVH